MSPQALTQRDLSRNCQLGLRSEGGQNLVSPPPGVRPGRRELMALSGHGGPGWSVQPGKGRNRVPEEAARHPSTHESAVTRELKPLDILSQESSVQGWPGRAAQGQAGLDSAAVRPEQGSIWDVNLGSDNVLVTEPLSRLQTHPLHQPREDGLGQDTLHASCPWVPAAD